MTIEVGMAHGGDAQEDEASTTVAWGDGFGEPAEGGLEIGVR